jgi:hypothetical protein
MYHKHYVEELLKKSIEGISRNNKVFKEFFLSQRALMIIRFIYNGMMIFNDIHLYYTLFKVFGNTS